MSAFVYGVGTSHFGRQPGVGGPELAQQAILEALRDADVDSVDAVYAGTVFGAPGTAQRALQSVGITGVPVLTFENACATSSTERSSRKRRATIARCRGASRSRAALTSRTDASWECVARSGKRSTGTSRRRRRWLRHSLTTTLRA